MNASSYHYWYLTTENKTESAVVLTLFSSESDLVYPLYLENMQQVVTYLCPSLYLLTQSFKNLIRLHFPYYLEINLA
ncbi:hypothetical protein [Cytobacillus gottheilii]|uniref:hypothetical protein n=1 Tax=Cytobacillus gottheilii TaxID=859144 RepID=UPI0034644516